MRGIVQGLGTFWQIVPSSNQPITTFPTPPYGYSFNYSIYTNITPPTQSVPLNSSVVLQGNFTTISGNGVAQPINQSGITYWGYVLSSPIIVQGALTDLYCIYNNPVGGNNIWYIYTTSTDSSLIGTTLTMNISII